MEATEDLFELSADEAAFQVREAYWGVELVPDTQRLGLMNLMLHGVEGTLYEGDALGDAGERLPPADVVLTNPPFGTKKGRGPRLADVHARDEQQAAQLPPARLQRAPARRARRRRAP